jgi:lantibiotic modifying enzyme
MEGANYILERLPSQMGLLSDTSLYHGGVAGLGYIMDMIGNYTGDIKYNQAADKVLAYVIARGTKTPNGLKLHSSNILRWGSTGLGLYLLDRYQRSRDPQLLTTIVSAAEYILSQVHSLAGDGLSCTNLCCAIL